MRGARVLAVVVLAVSWATPCAADPAPTTDGAPPSAALAALLAAKNDAGEPIVPPAARDYWTSLPEHPREMVDALVADETITSPQHLAIILGLAMPVSTFEMAMEDRCFLCHTDPEVHTGDTLMAVDPAAAGVPAHMNLVAMVQDVHFRRELSCAGCHGGDPTEPMGHDFVAAWPESATQRREDRSWIPGFCGRCHADPAFMRRFDPSMPTDQLEKFRESRHGQILAAGDSHAAQCVSCHGVHGIQGAKSPRSAVYPTNVPATCGACHADPAYMASYRLSDGSPLPTDQLAKYRESVHGRALLERGDLGAPACNDCHGNHAAMPPQVASVSQICRTCHARNGTLFDGSKHKQVFIAHGWPECDQCHGKHDITKTSDAMMAPGPASGPVSLCQACHALYAAHNPNCNATAAYFYTSLTDLAAGHARYERDVGSLARLGLDDQPMDDELAVLFDSLQQSRSYVHSFDRSDFDQVAAQGRESLAKLAKLEDDARGELSYRRTGLVVAIALIALLMLLLRLKLRRIESGPPD